MREVAQAVVTAFVRHSTHAVPAYASPSISDTEPWGVVAGESLAHIYDADRRHIAVIYDTCDDRDVEVLRVAAINGCQVLPLDGLNGPPPGWEHRPGPLHPREP